jgi:hypothetical protein
MAKAWKIAPGEHANAWPECREWGCIVFGWRELGNHARFDSETALRKAMKAAYRRGEPGTGPRAARSIWRFVKEVEPKHIVVANDGRGRVVGVGIVKSGYLAPGSPRNPSRSEWYKSARLVDWHITESVPLRKYFFVQDTVWPLDPSQCDEIKRAYVKEYPGLKKKLDELFEDLESHINLENQGAVRTFAGESDIEGLRSEYRATKAKRSRRLRNRHLTWRTGGAPFVDEISARFLVGEVDESCKCITASSSQHATRHPSRN